jgi:phospholipase C
MNGRLSKRGARAAMALMAMGGVFAGGQAEATDIPIKHVIIIMQENRSFDSYFGAFPGVNGIPAGICVPLNPHLDGGPCVRPFHDVRDVNAGGPHGALNSQHDLDDGITTHKMDGFIYEQAHANAKCKPDAPECAANVDGIARHDVVGYHTGEEIPNYWQYAKHFVLQENLFESVRSWSWPSHLYLTSEWAAVCSDPQKALSCATSSAPTAPSSTLRLPWVNLFQLLDSRGVSWKYYLEDGLEPDCEDDGIFCPAVSSSTPKQPSPINLESGSILFIGPEARPGLPEASHSRKQAVFRGCEARNPAEGFVAHPFECRRRASPRRRDAGYGTCDQLR